jgi:phage baseplate assembly protein V
MMVGRARVRFVNDAGPIQTMQVSMSAMETPDNRLRMTEFGFASNPPVGSDAIALHLSGDRGSGVVVATNHQPSRPRNLAAGESMLYSQDGKSVYITAAGGIVVQANGQDVVVNNAKDVTWNLSGKLKIVAPGGVEFDAPLVASTGDIQDNSATNARTMATMRTIYDVHNHPVPNVQPGSATVTTNAPNQQE